MFEIMTEIVVHSGIEAAREFAQRVNRHIEELRDWQARLDVVDALRRHSGAAAR